MLEKMKLRSDFISQELNDSIILVPLDGYFKGVFKVNESAAFIVDCLKEETTVEEIKSKLMARYNIDEKEAENSVKKIIDKLQEINALI